MRGIYQIGRDRFVVVHLPSRTRLTEFDRLRIARRWCEAIDGLADWDTADLPKCDGLGLRMHRLPSI